MLRTVNIKDNLHSALRLEAFDQNRSLQGLINEILTGHVDKRKSHE